VDLKTMSSFHRWSADGRRLFFVVDGVISEVELQTTPQFRVGVPRKLFSLHPLGTSGAYSNFDVSANGQRFLTIRSEPEAAIQRVVVVLDFKPAK